MCGRFAQFSSLETLKKAFEIKTVTCDVTPIYNIAPTQEILAIIRHDTENRLERLHWGLVPFWAKDLSRASKLINARIETVAKKPSFRNAFERRRCLILADGFYEWKKVERRKQPYFCTLPTGKPFAFAGLWETWKSKESDDEPVYHSCTILTIDSSESIREIHNRMPVILLPETHEAWLNPEIQDTKQLETILQEGYVREMKTYPVSTFVNSVKNNGPTCIEPITLES